MQGRWTRCGAIAATAVLLFAAAGCGASTATAPSRHAAASTAPGADAAHFQALANEVCVAVRKGLPAPLAASAGRAQLVRHARAALAPTRRTAVSLRRLPAPASTRPQLRTLSDAERDLQAAYTAIVQGRGGPGPRGLSDRERLASARALALGLPGCAGPQS